MQARAVLDFPNALWFDSFLLPLLATNIKVPIHWRSAMWFGIGIDNTRAVIKPYFNINRGRPLDRWKTIGHILRETSHPDCLVTLCELSRMVSKDSWPVGLTVDLGKSSEPTRMKVYFRSGRVDLSWLQNWYSETGYTFHTPAIRSLLDSFPSDGMKNFPEGTFVVALEFHLKSGAVSIKTDIALNKLGYECADAAEGTRRAIAHIVEDNAGIDTWFESLGIENADDKPTPLRFVGVGSEPDRSLHVNVYAEPAIEWPLQALASPRRSATKAMSNRVAAIERGLDFLSRQAKSKAWTDYRLPVGESDSWVTAYVLFRLADIHAGLVNSELRQRISDALDWLETAQSSGGGWGYNRQIEADADSTSLSLLALHRHGRTLPATAIKFLLSCMDTDGLFSTYPKETGHGGGWESAHLEITFTAWAALKGCLPPATWSQRVAGLVKTLQHGRRPPHYWWVTPRYCDATETCFRELHRRVDDAVTSKIHSEVPSGIPTRSRVGTNSFEIALALLSIPATYEKSRVRGALSADLIARQREDGSWPSSAWLRLVNPDCLQPSIKVNSGALFVDQHAIFTTATALSALVGAPKR